MRITEDERNIDELEPLEEELEPTEAEPEEEAAEAAPDSFRPYLREMAKYPLLNAAQQVALGQRIERGQVKLARALRQIEVKALRRLRSPLAGDRSAGRPREPGR